MIIRAGRWRAVAAVPKTLYSPCAAPVRYHGRIHVLISYMNVYRTPHAHYTKPIEPSTWKLEIKCAERVCAVTEAVYCFDSPTPTFYFFVSFVFSPPFLPLSFIFSFFVARNKKLGDTRLRIGFGFWVFSVFYFFTSCRMTRFSQM